MSIKSVKIIGMIILIVVLVGCSSTQNDSNNTMSTPKLSKDTAYVDTSKGDTTIYDGHGLYIEYRGLNFDERSVQLALYFENKTDETLYIELENLLINRSSVDVGNSAVELLNHSTYLVGPNANYIVQLKDLDAYNISTISEIDFTLDIWKNQFYGDEFLTLPVSIAEDAAID